tara:strand:+ start:1101 stop:1769 length:669 start_codon:yes stop_codon:yes gene_type:complete
MNAIELEVQSREARKRNRAKALRSSGRVPGVVYGGSDNQLVEVEHKVFERIMQAASSDTVLLDLKVGKDKRLALVQEVQHHPVSREPLHIDFREVKPDQKVIVTLPTVPVGEAVGVKTGGGNLEHVLRYVKVKGTPTSLPEVIETDIAKLDIGQTLLVRDMVVPEGVEILADPSNAVFSVTRPRVVAVSTDDQALAEGEGASEGGASSDKAKDESSGGEGDK